MTGDHVWVVTLEDDGCVTNWLYRSQNSARRNVQEYVNAHAGGRSDEAARELREEHALFDRELAEGRTFAILSVGDIVLKVEREGIEP